VVVLTADSAFEEQARATFGASDQIVLRVVSGTLAAIDGDFDVEGAIVAVIDLDVGQQEQMQALDRLMMRVGSRPPVVVVTQAFDESVARTLLQMRVADFLVKPVSPVELVRTCARVAKDISLSSPAFSANLDCLGAQVIALPNTRCTDFSKPFVRNCGGMEYASRSFCPAGSEQTCLSTLSPVQARPMERWNQVRLAV